MKDNVLCPFCGVWFQTFTESDFVRHPKILDCPLSNKEFTIAQWNTRPPRKEQPAMRVVESEVAWLRSIVRDVIAMKVVNVTLPNGVKVSEGRE